MLKTDNERSVYCEKKDRRGVIGGIADNFCILWLPEHPKRRE